jgi:hypothetical protein
MLSLCEALQGKGKGKLQLPLQHPVVSAAKKLQQPQFLAENFL